MSGTSRATTGEYLLPIGKSSHQDGKQVPHYAFSMAATNFVQQYGDCHGYDKKKACMTKFEVTFLLSKRYLFHENSFICCAINDKQ